MHSAIATTEPVHLESAERKSPEPHAPDWLPSYLPELDGLRGLAILGVFLFHTRPRLAATWLDAPAAWGWSGVSLFFVLSGFLITSILLRTQKQSRHYFRNFYARRTLRIWPVYFLLIAICYIGPAWLSKMPSGATKWQGFAALLLFVQNLFPIPWIATGALGPTWSLAIEEQFYLLWAPVVRFTGRSWHLAGALIGLLAASPFFRFRYEHSLNTTHTLLHLDGIAFGSLLALALLKLSWTRRIWFWLGIGSAFAGFGTVLSLAKGTVFVDSSIGLAFTGVVLAVIAGTGARNPAAWLLRHGPLPFYGQISYGLYLAHMPLFICLGTFYIFVDQSSIGGSSSANLLIVLVQLLVCTAAATLLWHGYEKRFLVLKRYFSNGRAPVI